MTFETCKQLFEGGTQANFSEILTQCPFASGFAGEAIGGALVALGIIIIGLLFAALYVYSSLAWYETGKKLKYKYAWLAWVPIARWAMILQMGGFHWAWIFLILIPIIGWIALIVIWIISLWVIFKRRKYPGWISLAIIIPQVGGILYLISIGFLAWGKKK